MTEEARPTMRGWILADPRARQFLDRLASDDEYRELLARDPVAALAEFNVPAEDVPAEVEVPPKEDVQRLLGNASDEDPFGNVVLPPDAGETLYSFMRPLAGAMPLVPADGGSHAG